MTSEFVESLQRLFSSGKIALFKLDELKNKGVISQNKLVDSLHFLASQTYKGEDMSSYSVLLEYKLPVSKAYKTAMLELTNELYKDMLEYKLPFDTEFTKEPGDVEVQLTFFKNEMGEDGVITQRVRHTTSTFDSGS